MTRIRSSFLILALGSAVLVGCGKTTTTGHIKGATYNRADTCSANQFIGNEKSHVVHRPGSTSLPSTKNQVCFNTLPAAQNAGYHLAR